MLFVVIETFRNREVIPPDDRRMIYQLANMLWHSDSSFKTVPALCSLLSARIVPPEGGATEFASTRAAYAALPPARQAWAETAVVVHDYSWSRDQIRPGFFTAEERAVYPPGRAPACPRQPRQRQEGPFPRRPRLPRRRHVDRGRPRAPQGTAGSRDPARFRYRHEWQEGDLVVWNNRCALRRATPYDTTRYKRLMQRTTISGDPAALTGVGR